MNKYLNLVVSSVALSVFLHSVYSAAQGQASALAEGSCADPAPLQRGLKLEGASNYILYSRCEPLKKLSVTIEVTSDMKADSKGFDFQLNADSLASERFPLGVTLDGRKGRVGWQQYIVNVRAGKQPNTTEISGFIEPWPTNYPEANHSDLVNSAKFNPYFLVTLAQTAVPTLPAGTQINIVLDTDDKNLNVDRVTFSVKFKSRVEVVNLHDKYYNGETIALLGMPLDSTLCGSPKHPQPDKRFCQNPAHGPGNLTTEDMAPITAFQLDFAGNTTPGFVPEGSGKIIYAVDGNEPLRPVPPREQVSKFPFLPVCATGADTAESSSYAYSTMPTCTGGGQKIKQTFEPVVFCTKGTLPYRFECDGSLFCAEPKNLERCKEEGTCVPLLASEPAWIKPPCPHVICKSVPPVNQRDVAGEWLARVVYDCKM